MSNLKPLSEAERAELIAYLDGELDRKNAQLVERKLQADPRIRAEADALRKTWELLDYLPRAEPSPTFTHRTLQRVSSLPTPVRPTRSERRWRPYALGLGWAAALLVAGAIGFAGGTRLSPREPSDEDLVRDLRIIENKRIFEQVEDLDFGRQLDHPDLFGDGELGS
jgi:anti-sigma factor RsiW